MPRLYLYCCGAVHTDCMMLACRKLTFGERKLWTQPAVIANVAHGLGTAYRSSISCLLLCLHKKQVGRNPLTKTMPCCFRTPRFCIETDSREPLTTVSPSQQEQDPTNLYIANLPSQYKETDLDNMLSKYGQVVSTRILRDPDGVSKGVGFARMESKEKCELIISTFNNHMVQGSKEPLLVKFADGGQKKRSPFRNDNRMWREATEALCAQGGHVTYDPTGLTQNGVAAQHMIPAYNPRYATQPLTTYPLHTQAHWPMQYVMHPPPHLTQVDNHGVLQMMQDPSTMQYNVIPQLTTQMHTLQLTTPPYIAGAHPYPFYSAPSIIHQLPMADNEHNSNTASPEEAYTAYPPPKRHCYTPDLLSNTQRTVISDPHNSLRHCYTPDLLSNTQRTVISDPHNSLRHCYTPDLLSNTQRTVISDPHNSLRHCYTPDLLSNTQRTVISDPHNSL
ncbi:RNA-binding motif, single-stranded-interacting protein 1 [Homalodisca vitripennis]|nr:RNA-binding motif, single-stranded-interacting protein 1 [Homalodisca vitripennis]